MGRVREEQWGDRNAGRKGIEKQETEKEKTEKRSREGGRQEVEGCRGEEERIGEDLIVT